MALPAPTPSSQPQAPAPSRLQAIKERAILVGSMLVLMWVLEVLDQTLFNQRLDYYGIHPRDPSSFLGILASPFLHGDLGHLAANSLPFLVLGFLASLRGIGAFVATTLFIVVVGGLCVWLIGGSNTVHIGASGLIFGYFGYLLATGFFERSLKSILVALFVGLAYGSLAFGLLPGKTGISWEAHLFGALAGGLWAFLRAKHIRLQAAKDQGKAKANL